MAVIRAPISSGYSAEVLAEAARRFPRLPVKAVISTSDAWPHFAGVREYAALGIPIYTLDLNRPAVMRSIDTPHLLRLIGSSAHRGPPGSDPSVTGWSLDRAPTDSNSIPFAAKPANGR